MRLTLYEDYYLESTGYAFDIARSDFTSLTRRLSKQHDLMTGHARDRLTTMRMIRYGY